MTLPYLLKSMQFWLDRPVAQTRRRRRVPVELHSQSEGLESRTLLAVDLLPAQYTTPVAHTRWLSHDDGSSCDGAPGFIDNGVRNDSVVILVGISGRVNWTGGAQASNVRLTITSGAASGQPTIFTTSVSSGLFAFSPNQITSSFAIGNFTVKLEALASGPGGGTVLDTEDPVSGEKVVCPAPPVTTPPEFVSPTPTEGQSVPLTGCIGEVKTIGILAQDTDAVGTGAITYSVNSNPWFTLAAGPVVQFSGSAPTGTYNVVVTATDDEGETATRSFTVVLTRTPAPGATTPSLATTNSGGVIEAAANPASQSVVINWTASSNAEDYEWQLWRYDGVAANDGWVLQSPTGSGNVLSTTYANLGAGLYSFFVRGRNCTNVKGPWAGLTFAIVAQGDLMPANSGQHNNYEDVCECDPDPPGEDVAGAHVNTGTGDMVLALGNLVSPAASSLSSYLFPTYVSGGDSQLTIDATIPLPANPTDVVVDVVVRNQSGVVVGLDTIYPGENSFQINLDGILSFRLDPANLKDSAGNPVAPLLTGNYTITANIRAELPGFAQAAPLSMVFQATTVSAQYVNPSDRSFAKSLAVPGLNRLRIDSTGMSLFRSNGTSVRFPKVSGSIFSTPDGSFTNVTAINQNVPDPLGGPDRIATWKLVTTAGMISFYDATGLLLQREDDGDVIRFSYRDRKGDGSADDLARLQSVNTNHNIDYTWALGKIQTVTDWVGRQWSYGYDAVSGLLSSVTGLPTSVNGPVPELGKPTPKVLLTYDAGTTQLASYSLADSIASFTETTEVDWDTYGNVSQIRALDTQGSSGGTRTWSFASAESRQLAQMRIVDIQGSIDPQDHFDQVTYPDASVAKTQIDNYGNTLREERTVLGYLANTVITSTYQRNIDGQATAAGPFVQSVDGTTTSVAAVNYVYDAQGRMTSASHPDGTTETWTYAAGASSSEPDSYTNRVGHFIDYGVYSDGSPAQIDYYASVGGVLISRTRYTYLHGRVKTVATTDPNGLGGNGVGMELYYDTHLNVTHTRTTTATAAGLIAAASVSDIWMSSGYDGFENPAWVTSQYHPLTLSGTPAQPLLADANLVAVRTDLTSDAYGRILQVNSPVPAAGQARLLWTFTYDAVGRMLTSIEPGSTVVLTRTTTNAYNSFGELKSVTLPDPDGIGSLGIPSMEFTYDSNGFLYEVRRMNGASAVSRQRSGFDSIGRQRFQSMTLPGASALLQANEATYYQFDAIGRVTKVESPVGTAGLNESKYLVRNLTYDDVLRKLTTSVISLGVGVINPGVADVVQQFDAIGRPTSITQGGLSTTTAYLDGDTTSLPGVAGTLVQTTDERGQIWKTKYGPTGLVRKTLSPDPDGAGSLGADAVTISYDYRGNTDIVTQSSTDASGSVTRTTNFDFDFRDLLTTVTSPTPNATLPSLVTTYSYDALQRQISESGPSGASILTSYRDDGLLGTVTRNDNNVATTDWFATYSYDNLNRVSGVTNPDGLTSLFYDSIGNISRTLTPDPDGDGALPRMSMTWNYASGTAGQFLQETLDTDNSQTKFTVDSAGRVIEQFRPKHLNPTGSDYSVVYADGTASVTATEKWSYDALGQVRTFTDALSNAVSYQYDTLSRLISVGDGTRSQTYIYSATNGDLTSSTDPLGRTTQFTGYDNLGRLTSSQRMLGANSNDVSTLSYDGFGRLKTSTALAGVSGKEMTTTWDYDKLDRMTKVTDALGGEQEYVYDTRGFLQRFDNERDHSTYFRYDDIGRLEARWTEGFSQTVGSTRSTYDAMDRVNTVTDPLNNVTDYDYDAVGRVTKRTDPVQTAGTPVTTYTYDADGNLATLTDPAGNITSWKYDHRNRLRQDTITLNSVAAIREYWYDGADNLFWAKDREEKWTRYTFDFAFGASGNYRLKEEDWWVSGSIYNNKITTSYDQAQGNGLLVTEVSDQRNLQTSSDVTSRVSFGYDALARMTSTKDWLQPNTRTEAFELKYFYADGIDRRTSTEARFVQFASGGTSETGDQFDFHNTYVWDKLNRVDVVTQQSANDPLAATWSAKAVTTRTVDLNYFADSSLQTISRTQGAAGSTTSPLVTTFTTVTDGGKNEGRIASIKHSGFTGGTANDRTYSYGYDDHGRIATFTTPAGTRTYAYDSFDQVTGATGGTQSAELYQYDQNGNRTNVPPASGGGTAVTGQYNRVTNDGTYTYLYDKEGNRTRRTLISTGGYELYIYDYRQRLTSVTARTSAGQTTQVTAYEYDGLDRRLRRTVTQYTYPGGVQTPTELAKQRFLYDTNVINEAFDEVVIVLDEQLSGSSYQKVDHRFLNGPDIDQVFADEAPLDSILWYLSDHQNTVRDVAKFDSTTAGSTPTVRNHLEYDSFGNVTGADDPTTGTGNDGDLPGYEGLGNEFSPQRSYTGREPDPATGLIYYRARWFDPKLGRFISDDPIGFAAGDANLSRYVGNNAPNAVDPSGLEWAQAISWHHLVPWELSDLFAKDGISFNFDAPDNGWYILRGDHTWLHSGGRNGWNKKWLDWYDEFDGIPDHDDIVTQLEMMKQEFKLVNDAGNAIMGMPVSAVDNMPYNVWQPDDGEHWSKNYERREKWRTENGQVGPDGNGKRWCPSDAERQRVRAEDNIRQELKRKDQERRVRTVPDVKKERIRREAQNAAESILDPTPADQGANRPRHVPDGDSIPEVKPGRWSRVFSAFGKTFDFLDVIEYPAKAIWQGRDPLDIFEEDTKQEMKGLEQKPIIFDPFGGFIGPNPYYLGPDGRGPSA